MYKKVYLNLSDSRWRKDKVQLNDNKNANFYDVLFHVNFMLLGYPRSFCVWCRHAGMVPESPGLQRPRISGRRGEKPRGIGLRL